MTTKTSHTEPWEISKQSPSGKLRSCYSTDRVRALEAIRSLRQTLDRQEEQCVFGLRMSGMSWADIGEALGTTRQAAHHKFQSTAGLLDKLAEAAGRPVKP